MTLYTKQTAFDTAVNGMRAQGGPSYRSTSESGCGCRYRSEQGRKCAVGQLIPDDRYDPEMESRNLEAVIAPLNLGVGYDFLREFQGCHDSVASQLKANTAFGDWPTDAAFMRQFEKNVEEFAIKHALVYTPPINGEYNMDRRNLLTGLIAAALVPLAPAISLASHAPAAPVAEDLYLGLTGSARTALKRAMLCWVYGDSTSAQAKRLNAQYGDPHPTQEQLNTCKSRLVRKMDPLERRCMLS